MERTPIWLMRQAGRYLPEYREIREKRAFLEVCRTPDLAIEVAMQPMRRFGFDAAILFSDILVPAEAMGLDVAFVKGTGPVIRNPIRIDTDLDRLRVVPSVEKMGFVADVITGLRTELGPTPVIGFAGAPFTMAAYAIEGGKASNLLKTRQMMYSRPTLFHALLDRFAEQVLDYLHMQCDAGVAAVQLFDTRAGVLSPQDYATFALPPLRRIFYGLAGRVPRIAFALGGGNYLPLLASSGADVLGVDWTADLKKAAGLGLPVQGNLDPAALHAPKEELRRRIFEVRRLGTNASGHVFNLGHGISKDTPISAIETLVECVREPLP